VPQGVHAVRGRVVAGPWSEALSTAFGRPLRLVQAPPGDAIDRVFREEHGRVVASLIRRFGDIDLAEDAAAEALLAAVERWPADGVPPNPGGWLTTTAARRAIDKNTRQLVCDPEACGGLTHKLSCKRSAQYATRQRDCTSISIGA
jgi:predicted RNA polymerase sigma factor